MDGSKVICGDLGLMPASIDPIHFGHLRVLERALTVLKKVTLGLGFNSRKLKERFPVERRVEIATAEVARFDGRVTVQPYEGLTVDFAHEIGACCLVRGVRSQTDLDQEMQMAIVNNRLYARRYGVPLETVMFWAGEDVRSVASSSLIMQLLDAGCSEEELADFAPPGTLKALLDMRAAGE